MKPIGYIVVEYADDYEQVLGLRIDAKTPPAGILTWAKPTERKAMFASRADALAAIKRTEHYRLAFGLTGCGGLSEKKNCRVESLTAAPVGDAKGGE